jgi:hypothetical protein
MLFEYVGEIMTAMITLRNLVPDNLDIRQESLIFQYLLSIYKNIDSLAEE